MSVFRLSICLAPMIFSLSAGHAQSDFRSGYIVTSSKDTIQGWVDSRSEFNNASQVYFKRMPSAEASRYEASGLLAYGFTGSKMYEAKMAKVDSARAEVAFFELLIKGKMSLYHYKNNDRFYVQKEAQEMMPLFETKVKLQHEDKTYFIETRKIYLGLLNSLMADCPAVQKMVKNTKLSYSSLMDLVNAYNNCGADKNSLQTKRTFLHVKKGILAGVQSTSIQFSTISATLVEYQFLTKADFAADIQPFGGVFINTTSPWITENVSLQLEAQFAKAHYYSNTAYRLSNGYIKNDECTIDLTYLRFPLLVRYTYPRGNWRPFIQAGILNDLVLNKKVHLISKEQGSQSSVHTTELTGMNMSNYYLFGTLGAGISHPFFEKLIWCIEARGAIGNSMGDNALKARYKAQTNILSLQMSVSF